MKNEKWKSMNETLYFADSESAQKFEKFKKEIGEELDSEYAMDLGTGINDDGDEVWIFEGETICKVKGGLNSSQD